MGSGSPFPIPASPVPLGERLAISDSCITRPLTGIGSPSSVILSSVANRDRREHVKDQRDELQEAEAEHHRAIFGQSAQHGAGDVEPEGAVRLAGAAERDGEDHRGEQDRGEYQQARLYHEIGGEAQERIERNHGVHDQRRAQAGVVGPECLRLADPDEEIGDQDHHQDGKEHDRIDHPGAAEQQRHMDHRLGFDQHEAGAQEEHASVEEPRKALPVCQLVQ